MKIEKIIFVLNELLSLICFTSFSMVFWFDPSNLSGLIFCGISAVFFNVTYSYLGVKYRGIDAIKKGDKL